MAEFSDAGASIPHVPEVQLGAVNGELAAATQSAGKPSADNMGFNAAVGAAVSMFLGPVGVAISMALSIKDGMSGNSPRHSRSTGANTQQKTTPVNIMAAVSPIGGHAVPVQEAKPAAATAQHLTKLRLEQANMRRALENRFEGTSGTNRLRDEFARGATPAVAATENLNFKFLDAPVKPAAPHKQLKQSQFVLAG